MRTTEFKSITLITSPGKGLPLIEKLHKQQLTMVDLHHARGSSIGTPTKRNGIPFESEQEIVTCIVNSEQADAVFTQIYELAGVNSPDGGFMYMQKLKNSTQLILPMNEEQTTLST